MTYFSRRVSAPPANPNFTFLAIGRLDPQKDFSTLIKAAAILVSDRVNFSIRIIGAGVEVGKLKREVKNLDLGHHVQLLGAYDRTQIRDELRSCNALVMSSRHENQPVAILEALACGKSVVSTNWKGVTEVIGGDIGFLCKMDNAHDLAEKMKLQIQKPVDSTIVRAYFDKCFGTEKTVNALEEVYNRVI